MTQLRVFRPLQGLNARAYEITNLGRQELELKDKNQENP